MALFTITTAGKVNLPPSQIGDITLKTPYGVPLPITVSNVTSETVPPYQDPENDQMYRLRVITLSAATTGEMQLSGVPVAVNDEIDVADITAGNLIFVPNNATTTAVSFTMTFDLSDAGSLAFSGLPSASLDIDVEAQSNSAPTSVGDRTEGINYGDTLVFTRAMFTTLTTPPYSDPEGDAAGVLKITSLPVSGTIRLSGVPVVVNQQINFTDIDASNLTYTNDLTVIAISNVSFGFEIADVGSGQFTGTP